MESINHMSLIITYVDGWPLISGELSAVDSQETYKFISVSAFEDHEDGEEKKEMKNLKKHFNLCFACLHFLNFFCFDSFILVFISFVCILNY